MPTAPSHPRYKTDEDDEVTPLPPPVQPTGLPDDEPEVQVASAPIARPAPPQAARMDAPDRQTRIAAQKIQTGAVPSTAELRRIAERQRLESGGAVARGGEGMDAPDLQTRVAALKTQLGPTARITDQERGRIVERQRLEQQNGVAPDRSLAPLLEGSALDPKGTRQQQAVAARRAEIERRRQEQAATKEAQRQRNNQREAQFRGTGQKFYADAHGEIQPVIEAGTNRPLYSATLWEDGGVHPQTKEPTLVKRDQYGQRQYKTPPVVASPDLTDTQLYYKFAEDDLRPAGDIAALKAHANPAIARLAKKADAARRAAAWKEAIAPMEAAKMGAEGEYDLAQQRNIELQGQIEQLTQQAATIPESVLGQTSGGFLGIGASPTPEAQAAQGQRAVIEQQIQTLTLEQTTLQEQLKPMGALGRMKRNAALDLAIFKAKAKHESYTDLAEERRDILRQQGKDEASDPILKSILQAQAAYGAAVERAAVVTQREAEAEEAQQPVSPPAPESPNGGVIAQTGKALARGATSEGLYAGSEGVSRLVAESPVRSALDSATEFVGRKITETVQGFPLTEEQKATRARLLDERRKKFGGKFNEEIKGYAEQTARLREQIRRALPVDQKFIESTGGQIAQGVGQLGGTLPTAVIPGGMAISSIGQIYDEGRQDALRAGANEAAAHSAAMKYLPAASLDFLSNRLILGKLLKPMLGKVTVKQIAKDVLATTAGEGLTEGAQQGFLNQVASKLAGYSPDRPFDQEVLDSILVGAVVGGGTTAVGQGAKVMGARDGAVPPAAGGPAPKTPPGAPPTDTAPAPITQTDQEKAEAEFQRKLADGESSIRPLTPEDKAGADALRKQALAKLEEAAKNDPELARLLAESEAVDESNEGQPVSTPAPVETPAPTTAEIQPASEAQPVQPVAASVAPTQSKALIASPDAGLNEGGYEKSTLHGALMSPEQFETNAAISASERLFQSVAAKKKGSELRESGVLFDYEKAQRANPQFVPDRPEFTTSGQVSRLMDSGLNIRKGHEMQLRLALQNKNPVNAEAIDTYRMELPAGYVREGDQYIWRSASIEPAPDENTKPPPQPLAAVPPARVETPAVAESAAATPAAAEVAPVGPETENPDLATALSQYEDSGEIQTAADLVDHVEAMIADGTAPASLAGALEKYRAAAKEDFEELGGRGDMDSAENEFVEQVRRVAGVAPAAETAPVAAAEAVTPSLDAIRNAKSGAELSKVGGALMMQARGNKAVADVQRAMKARLAELVAENKSPSPEPPAAVTDITPKGMGALEAPVSLRSGSAPAVQAESDYTRGGGRYFVRPVGSTEAFEVGSLADAKIKYAEVAGQGARTGAEILDADKKRVGVISADGAMRITEAEKPKERAVKNVTPEVKEIATPDAAPATPPAQMKRPALRAELKAAGVDSVSGVPVDEANAAQLMNAVGKLRRGQLDEPSKPTPDKIIEALQKAKIHKPGQLSAATPLSLAWDGAIDLAILGVRAGRAVEQVVRLAIDRFRAKHPTHTPEDLTRLEADIRKAISDRPPEPEPGKNLSKVPPSLRAVGTPAEDIEYDVRAQNARMAEARAIVSRDGAKAEAALADRSLPGDTRVAIGGVLLEQKMEAMKTASPAEALALSKDIQRITAATRSGVSTEAGQAVSIHNKIYENLAVGSAMEYARSATQRRIEQMGGEEAEAAMADAAAELNKAQTPEERAKAIDKLKEKYTTKPVRRALDELKRIEVAKELNRLGVLTRDDLVEVAGNALGLPGIEPSKLKHIATLVDRINNAKNHAERSRAEVELADTMVIYKGVSPLDMEASILTLNILSGPTTQGANIEGNALNLITQLGTTAAVNPTRLGPIMRGIQQGIPLGWDQAKSILATGRGTKDFQDRTLGAGNTLNTVDYAREFPALNKTAGDLLTKRARIVEKISRFMRAADAVFYYPAREAYARLVTTKLLEGNFSGPELARRVSETLHTTPEAFVAARQQATAEGYTGIELGRRVADIIEEQRLSTPTGTDAVKQSERFAAEATFNNEPVGLAGVVYRNLARTVKDADVGGVPVLKPWAMFLRVPANVFNATTNFTPLGAMRAASGMKGEAYRKGGTGEGQWRNFTADERNRLYLQSVIGTTLMGGLVARILDKDDVEISAGGPKDATKRNQLKQGGWNPYSIRVGKRWISYKDSPLLVPLAIVGHVADALRYQKAKSELVLGNRVLDAAAHAPQIIFQTSMLSGLSNLMAALSGQGDVSSEITRTLGSIPANLVIPYNRLLQQVDQSFDDRTYENNPAKGAVPFLRRTGTPQTDVQGRPRTFDPSSRFATTESADRVDTLLREKNVFIPDVGKDARLARPVLTTAQQQARKALGAPVPKIGERPIMADAEREAYRRISGQRIRVRLMAIEPRLRMMNQEAAQKEISRIAEDEREKVRPLIQAGVGVRK